MKALIDQRNNIQQKLESAADHEDGNPPSRTTILAQDWIRKVEEPERLSLHLLPCVCQWEFENQDQINWRDLSLK